MKLLSLYRGEIEAEPVRHQVTLKSLLSETAVDHDLVPSHLMSISRKAHIARARQDFMWRARQVRWSDGSHRYSLPMIAQFLGGMDHTTVIHGVRAHEARLAQAQERAA